MASTLLDISGKPSPFEVEIFDTIHLAASQLEIPFLVVGASARDLILHHAHGVDIVRVRDHPALDIPVVTMAGLSILKIIAWTNRTPDLRKKDAIDLLYRLKNYERIPAVNEGAYEVAGLMEQYGWDATLAGLNKDPFT